jgi:hypothetical protein
MHAVRELHVEMLNNSPESTKILLGVHSSFHVHVAKECVLVLAFDTGLQDGIDLRADASQEHALL